MTFSNVLNPADFTSSPSVAAVLAKTVMSGEDETPSFANKANKPNRSPDPATGGNDARRSADPVIALRLDLRANGYHPVPITAPKLGDKACGKKPVLENWWNVCATADEAKIRGWPRKWTNTGLLCGVSTVAGALVGVDVDVLDESLSQQIEQIAIRDLGPSPLRRVGRAPKFLLAYRVAEPKAKISTKELTLPSGEKAKVEILAKGQQFVAYGIHPDTRRNYEWGDARPDSTPLADLPVVTHQALKNFKDQAEQLILQAGGKASKSANRKSDSRRSDKKRSERSEGEARPIRQAPEWSEAEAERIREALQHIPADDRKVWLDVGMALHSTGWGEPVRMVWDEWSRTAPEKFDAKDQNRTWESFRSERSDGIANDLKKITDQSSQTTFLVSVSVICILGFPSGNLPNRTPIETRFAGPWVKRRCLQPSVSKYLRSFIPSRLGLTTSFSQKKRRLDTGARLSNTGRARASFRTHEKSSR